MWLHRLLLGRINYQQSLLQSFSSRESKNRHWICYLSNYAMNIFTSMLHTLKWFVVQKLSVSCCFWSKYQYEVSDIWFFPPLILHTHDSPRMKLLLGTEWYNLRHLYLMLWQLKCIKMIIRKVTGQRRLQRVTEVRKVNKGFK